MFILAIKKRVTGKIKETFEVQNTERGKKVTAHKIFDKDEDKDKVKKR